MKKICFSLLLALVSSFGYAQDSVSFDITTPLKLWLLNNEAKAMEEISLDTTLLNRSSTLFSMLPTKNTVPARAEEKLWQIHRKIYTFIDEVQNIYDLAKHFGSGKFSVSIKQARPEIWCYTAFVTPGFTFPKVFYNKTRKGYLESLFIVMGLEISRDRDLSSRLKVAIKTLKDEEYRLFREYLNSFKALYPNERSVVQLDVFLTQGTAKPFGAGISEIIKSADALQKDVYSPQKALNSNNVDTDDPLAELESLTKSAVEEGSKPLSSMEAPDKDTIEMYDLGL